MRRSRCRARPSSERLEAGPAARAAADRRRRSLQSDAGSRNRRKPAAVKMVRREDSCRKAERGCIVRLRSAERRRTAFAGSRWLASRSRERSERIAKAGAEGGTRTPTRLLPPAPQAGASANSATSASGPVQANGRTPNNTPRVSLSASMSQGLPSAGGRGGSRRMSPRDSQRVSRSSKSES